MIKMYNRSLYHLLQSSVERFSTRPVLRYGAQYLTYAELEKKVKMEIESKKQKGLLPHHRVLHQGYNSVDFVVNAFSTWGCGATFVPVAPTFPKKQLLYISYLVRPFICHTENCSDLTWVRPVQSLPLNEYPYDNMALILFTSGTTSQPKAVTLSHQNVMANLEMIDKRTPKSFIHETDVSYAFLPWYHCYGFVCELLFVISRGGQLVIPTSRDPVQLVKELSWSKPTILFTVPRFLQNIKKVCYGQLWWMPTAWSKRLLLGNHLRAISIGGASIDSDTFTFFSDSKQIPLIQGYGCTETSPMISLSSPESHVEDFQQNPTSCGALLDGIEAYISDKGTLCVRGPNLTPGYLNEHNLTYRPREQFLDDGFFDTLDTCNVKDGHVSFQYRDTNRWKLSNGKFINPGYIESLILQMPGIEQCCVIGNNQPHLKVCVYTNHRESKETLEKRITTHLQHHHLQPYEIPRQVILMTHPLSVEEGTLSIKHEPNRRRVEEQFYFDQ